MLKIKYPKAGDLASDEYQSGPGGRLVVEVKAAQRGIEMYHKITGNCGFSIAEMTELLDLAINGPVEPEIVVSDGMKSAGASVDLGRDYGRSVWTLSPSSAAEVYCAMERARRAEAMAEDLKKQPPEPGAAVKCTCGAFFLDAHGSDCPVRHARAAAMRAVKLSETLTVVCDCGEPSGIAARHASSCPVYRRTYAPSRR